VNADKIEDALAILACDLGARPPGAPGAEDIVHALVGATRSADTLALAFDPSAATDVEAFVAAERQCCSTLDWQVERLPHSTVVRIAAAPDQLDVLEQAFAT
jgi:hypothetical protein